MLELARERRVEARTELVTGHAAEVIAHYASAYGPDLIVIGHRGHLLRDYMLGSTADRVAHYAHCPVIVVRLMTEDCERTRHAAVLAGAGSLP